MIRVWILCCEVARVKLRNAVWSVLKFELLWKLVTLVVISPAAVGDLPDLCVVGGDLL